MCAVVGCLAAVNV